MNVEKWPPKGVEQYSIGPQLLKNWFAQHKHHPHRRIEKFHSNRIWPYCEIDHLIKNAINTILSKFINPLVVGITTTCAHGFKSIGILNKRHEEQTHTLCQRPNTQPGLLFSGGEMFAYEPDWWGPPLISAALSHSHPQDEGKIFSHGLSHRVCAGFLIRTVHNSKPMHSRLGWNRALWCKKWPFDQKPTCNKWLKRRIAHHLHPPSFQELVFMGLKLVLYSVTFYCKGKLCSFCTSAITFIAECPCERRENKQF